MTSPSEGDIHLDVRPDVSRFRAELRAQLRDLEAVRAAVVPDTRRFAAQLRAELRRIGPVDVRVNVDTAAAQAGINAVTHGLNRIDGRRVTAHINVDTRGALAAIGALHTGLNRLATMRTRIDINVNLRPPGVIAQLTVLQGLLSRLNGADARSTVHVNTQGAQAGIQALIAAGIAIGPAIVPAAAAAAAAIGAIGPAAFAAAAGIGVGILAFQGVGDAVSALGAAQSKAAKTGATYAQQAKQIASAQDQVRSAVSGVGVAERNLANAQRDALRAQQDINRAREEAKDALEDLNSSVANNGLSIRQANLDLADAEKALAAVQRLPADNRQRIEAQLAYDQAAQSLKDLTTRQGRLKEEQEAAAKAGVEGSQQVRTAQERAADAQERILDAERSLVEARQQVVAAQRNLATAYTTTGATGGAALDTLREKMAALTPAGREFALFLHGLRPVFAQIKAAAETGLFPGLQAGMQAMLPVLPQIVLFVNRVASAMGRLFEAAGKALASPFWVQFFDVMGQAAGPLLEALGGTIGGLAEGFASLLIAFTPFSIQFMQGMAGMAQAFADWAAGLKDDEGFQRFIAFVTEHGPTVLTLLGQLTILLINLGIALAPLGVLVLDNLTNFLTWLNQQDPVVILALTGAVVGLFAAFAGGPIAMAAAVTLLAGVWANLYSRVEGFRTAVDAAGRGIQTVWRDYIKPTFDVWWSKVRELGVVFAEFWEQKLRPALGYIGREFGWLKETVLDPLFKLWLWWMDKVGTAVVWLWQHAILPAFTAIGAIMKFFWENVTKPALTRLVWFVENILAPVLTWLWRNIFEPVFIGLGIIASTVWNNVLKPIFQAFASFVSEHVAPKFSAAVNALGTIWARLQTMALTPIKFIVNTVLNDGLLAAYNWVADQFGLPVRNLRIRIPAITHGDAATSFSGVNSAFGSGGNRASFASGGFVSGPGTGTSDSIMARLSNGEYVIPAAIVRQFGVGFFDWLIGKQGKSKTARPGDGSEGMAFAEGGLVGWLKGAWNGLSDPLGGLRTRAVGLLGGTPGNQYMRQFLAGPATRLIDGVVRYLRPRITNLTSAAGYSGPISADVAAVRDWVVRQRGKPYIWASAGPEGYDCSGIVSAAYNMLRGRSPHNHTFSTHVMENYFTKRGVTGPLTAGWSHAGERQGGSVGHTAANIAGVPFESRGSRGVIVGQEAVPYQAFARWGTYDSGGMLPRGLSLAYNGTRHEETIRTFEQERALQARLDGSDRSLVSVGTMHVTNTTPGDIATELLWKLKTT